MNQSEEQPRSVVIEKIFAHPPGKLWRALTEPALVTQWLLRSLESTVEFTLTPEGGTRLRMEHSGFRANPSVFGTCTLR